jgi:glycosyltransferase involved in cell wall biosynthesis
VRILTFLHSFEPGGVERIALRLVREWRASGMEAPLYIGRNEGAMRDDVAAGLDYTILPQPRVGTARWETLWMILTLPRVIRDQRPDILFCAGNTYAVVAVAAKLLLGRACPPVIAKVSNDLYRRDKSWWSRWSYRAWLRLKARFIDHAIGMEDAMRDEIRRCMGIPGDAISIIPDPALSDAMIEQLRAAARPMAGGSTEGRRFVAVGRLVAQKNIALMLRAFAAGAGSRDQLTIIGDGPERSKLERLAGRLHLAGRVRFAGYHPDPASILPDFDILLLSSDYEGVPAVVLEALAARLAIIATDCSSSMRALLQGGKLGDLVEVGDEPMLASAIARVRVGRQDDGLSLAQAQRFTLERASQRYIEAMAELHASSRPPQRISDPDCGARRPLPS